MSTKSQVFKSSSVFTWQMTHIFKLCSLVCLCEQDSNMRDLFGPRFLIQRGCTYDKVEYRTAVLPGCPADTNRAFTYPVALSCHCGACRTDSDECAHRASVDGAGCTKPVRRLYPYSDQRDYMIPFWSSWCVNLSISSLHCVWARMYEIK